MYVLQFISQSLIKLASDKGDFLVDDFFKSCFWNASFFDETDIFQQFFSLSDKGGKVLSGLENDFHIRKLVRIDFTFIHNLLSASFKEFIDFLFVVKDKSDILVLVYGSDEPPPSSDFDSEFFVLVESN